jgi:serine/threonine protein kinase
MDREPAFDTEALARLRRIDRICLRFEALWRQGQRPRLEEFLDSAEPAERPELLAELLKLEWDYRHNSGEAIERGEYARRLPGWDSVVESVWTCRLERMQTTTGIDSPSTVMPPDAPSTVQARHSAPTEVPALLEGYLDLQELGRGGMGVVYRAFNPRLTRYVAIKMLHTAVGERLERFRLEARAMARLTHPHVVQVHDLEEKPGQPPLLVMEYVEGGSLEARLAQGPLSPSESARLVAVLARAVQAAHSAGVVHRDLKPANVLLGAPIPGNPGNVAGGFPKVTDFGLAQLADAQVMTLDGAIVGTPAYMAPEQADGRTADVGRPADVWALGVILYRCLTGVLPFSGANVMELLEKVKSRKPVSPRRLVPAVPAALEALCLRCLDKDPARRPTAEELAAALEQWEASDRGDTVPIPTPSRRRSRRLAVAGALVLVVMAGVGAWASGLLGRLAFGSPSEAEEPREPEPIAKRQEEKPQPRKEGDKIKPADDKKGVPAAPVEPVGVASMVVHLWNETPTQTNYRGELGRGEGTREANFGDGVTLEVTLSEPAYAYLIAYNANDSEQLLWPVNKERRPDANVKPPRVEAFKYPDRKGPNGEPFVFVLEDEEKGGWQAFVVVASRQPLPAFADWVKKRGPVQWVKGQPGNNVWHAREGKLSLWPSKGVQRGHEREMRGTPPLVPLVRKLRAAPGVDMAEGWAFPVRAKRK